MAEPQFQMPEMRQVVFPVAIWPALERFLGVIGMGLGQIPPEMIPGDDTPTYVLVPLADIERAKANAIIELPAHQPRMDVCGDPDCAHERYLHLGGKRRPCTVAGPTPCACSSFRGIW